MAGVIAVPKTLPIGAAISDLELILSAGTSLDFTGRVVFLPL